LHNKIIDIGILLSRLDKHESRINSLEMEVDQLKKKNLELEEKNSKLILATADEKLSVNDDVTRREFVPRSCFEVKAANPNAQSGEYFIDPDGQIGENISSTPMVRSVEMNPSKSTVIWRQVIKIY